MSRTAFPLGSRALISSPIVLLSVSRLVTVFSAVFPFAGSAPLVPSAHLSPGRVAAPPSEVAEDRECGRDHSSNAPPTPPIPHRRALCPGAEPAACSAARLY